jgi:hypothetical protein
LELNQNKKVWTSDKEETRLAEIKPAKYQIVNVSEIVQKLNSPYSTRMQSSRRRVARLSTIISGKTRNIQRRTNKVGTYYRFQAFLW